MYQSKYFQNDEHKKNATQQTEYKSKYFASGKNNGAKDTSETNIPTVPLITMTPEPTEKDGKTFLQKLGDILNFNSNMDTANSALAMGALFGNKDMVNKGVEMAQTAMDNQVSSGEEFRYSAERGAGGAAKNVEGFINALGYLGQQGTQAQAMQNASMYGMLGDLTGIDRYKGVSESMGKVAEELNTVGLQDTAKFGTKYQQNIQERYADADITKTGQFVGGVSEAVGGLLPSVAANAVAPGSGIVVSALSAGGNATQEALASGASDHSALAYGVAVGALEAATEKVFDGMAGIFGKGAADDVIDSIAKKLAKNETAQKAFVKVANSLGEGLEEFITEYGQRVANELIVNTDDRTFKETSKDALTSAIMGAIVGGIVQTANGLLPNASANPSALAEQAANTAAEQFSAETSANPEILPATAQTDVLATSTPLEQKTAPNAVNGAKAVNEESTVINTDPTQHTDVEQKVIDEYQGAVDDNLVNFVENSIANKGSNKGRYTLKPVSDKAALDIKNLTGVNTSGFKTVIEQRIAEHIVNRHGANGAANKSMADINDVARMQYVIDNYDRMEYGGKSTAYTTIKSNGRPGQADTVKYIKAVNGTYYVVEAVPDTKAKTTYIVSAYMENKNEASNQHPVLANGPTSTPKSAGAAKLASPATTVSQSEPVVNSGDTESVGAAPAGFDPLSNMYAEYGIIPEGESPARMVDLPKSTTGKDRVSYSVRNAMEAKATPDELVPDIGNAALHGEFSYIPVPNKQAKAMAEASIKRAGSFSSALANWTAEVRSGKTSEKLTAMGALLYNEAANSGDKKLAISILADYCASVRRGARAVQAARILKTLSPEYKLLFVQESVNKMNEAAKEKASRKIKAKDNVPVEQWMTRVGEDLANNLVSMSKMSESKAKTVSQEVLSDLKNYANAVIKKSKGVNATQSVRKSAEAKFFDLLNNWEHYNEAIDAARASILEKSDKDPSVLAALDSWLNSSANSMLVQNMDYGTDIVVDEAYINEYLQAKTDKARDEALDKIYQNIADQVPSTLADKFTALRYLNMLGNLKTQVRNVGGNVLNLLVRDIDHHIQALIQSVYHRDPTAKTVTFTGDKNLRKLAKSDFDSYKRSAMGEQKYSSSPTAKLDKEINERRTIFKSNGKWGTTEAEGFSGSLPARAVRTLADKAVNPLLEGYRRLTSGAMDLGDEVFARYAYSDAMSRYLKAKGYTAEQWQSGEIAESVLDEARSHASKEAQEATFRDSNAFSDALSKVGFKRPDNAVEKTLNTIVQGVQPFVRTPANVAVQAEKHSPLGIFNTIVTAAKANKPGGDIDANDVIKSASETLTGIGLTVLGVALGAAGVATAGRDEDDEKAAMDALTGGQEYAITIGDKSYTYDSLTPAAMPFALGVELQKSAERNGLSLAGLFDAIGSATDVMLNMSMMSGVNDAIEKVSYSDAPLADLAVNAVASYFTQGLTSTLLGQVERSTETQRMSTFRDKNNEILGTSGQVTLGKASAKTPGFDYNQIPYIDAWGRTEETGDTAQRIFNNFINPFYSSKKEETPADAEIYRLLSMGHENVAPDTVSHSQKVNKEYLTADQYVEFATTKGQTSFDLVTDMVGSEFYKNLNDTEKAEAIQLAYSYAGALASKAVDKSYKFSGASSSIQKAVDKGIDAADYIMYYSNKSDYDTDGNKSYTTAENIAAIEASGFTGKERIALYMVTFPKWVDGAEKRGVDFEDFMNYKIATDGASKKADKIAALMDAGYTYVQAVRMYKTMD